MYEKILEALNEALAMKEQELKYWRDRAETMEAQAKQYAKQADEAEELRCKHMDELDALYASNMELQEKLKKSGKKEEKNKQMDGVKGLLHEVQEALKHYEEEWLDDGGADPDGKSGE